jgi:hypothetical protein
MNITVNEIEVLRAIATNCFNHMNYGVPTTYEEANAEIWKDCINDAKYSSSVTSRALSGVCSSLVKKGLIISSSETIRLTEKGFEAFKASMET